MRKITEVMRLRFELKFGLPTVGRSCAIGVSTVHKYLKRAEAVGLTWPLPKGWDESRVEAALFPRAKARTGRLQSHASPAGLRRRPRATPQSPPRDHAVAMGGISRSRPGRLSLQPFLRVVSALAQKLDVVMRQEHKAGEKTFVDWAGSTIPIYDRVTRRGMASVAVRRRARRQFLHLG